MADENKRSALQPRRHPLAVYMANKHLFLACTEQWWEAGVGERRQWRDVERFKQTGRFHAEILFNRVWESVE